MARLSLVQQQILRKKELMTLFLQWSNILRSVEWFLKVRETAIKDYITTSFLRRQLYTLDRYQ